MKRTWKKYLKSEDSEFSDDSSQSYESDMSSENINRPISSDSEKTESDIQLVTWMKAGPEQPHFPFIGKPGLNIKITNLENPLLFFEICITSETTEQESH